MLSVYCTVCPAAHVHADLLYTPPNGQSAIQAQRLKSLQANAEHQSRLLRSPSKRQKLRQMDDRLNRWEPYPTTPNKTKTKAKPRARSESVKLEELNEHRSVSTPKKAPRKSAAKSHSSHAPTTAQPAINDTAPATDIVPMSSSHPSTPRSGPAITTATSASAHSHSRSRILYPIVEDESPPPQVLPASLFSTPVPHFNHSGPQAPAAVTLKGKNRAVAQSQPDANRLANSIRASTAFSSTFASTPVAPRPVAPAAITCNSDPASATPPSLVDGAAAVPEDDTPCAIAPPRTYARAWSQTPPTALVTTNSNAKAKSNAVPASLKKPFKPVLVMSKASAATMVQTATPVINSKSTSASAHESENDGGDIIPPPTAAHRSNDGAGSTVSSTAAGVVHSKTSKKGATRKKAIKPTLPSKKDKAAIARSKNAKSSTGAIDAPTAGARVSRIKKKTSSSSSLSGFEPKPPAFESNRATGSLPGASHRLRATGTKTSTPVLLTPVVLSNSRSKMKLAPASASTSVMLQHKRNEEQAIQNEGLRSGDGPAAAAAAGVAPEGQDDDEEMLDV